MDKKRMFFASGLKIDGELVDAKPLLDTHSHMKEDKTYSIDIDKIATGSVTVPLTEDMLSIFSVGDEQLWTCDYLILTDLEVLVDGEWQALDEEGIMQLPEATKLPLSWRAEIRIGESFKGILKPYVYAVHGIGDDET